MQLFFSRMIPVFLRSHAASALGVRTNNGGANRDRTDDPLLAKQVLSQLSYSPVTLFGLNRIHDKMVGPGRLELPTSRLSGVRSNHLSYGPWLVGEPGAKHRRRNCASPIVWRPPSEGQRRRREAAVRKDNPRFIILGERET